MNNNFNFSQIGFGTCKHSLNRPIDDILLNAMEIGYRYFDTASYYETERDLGRAIKQSGLDRKDLTIATKLWYEELGYKNAKEALSRSLDRLDLDYVDLYLIHWPKDPKDSNWKQTLDETWQAMKEMRNQGLIRALGVSNFLPHHIEVLDEKPIVDELEMHLGYFQEYAYNYLIKNDIKVQAWSPIGRGKSVFTTNSTINDMAKKYGVSAQQLSLKYLLQRNVMPLPWTTSETHMRENLELNLDISKEDMSMLSCMPQETWLGEHPDFNFPSAKHINQNQ